MKVRVAIVEPDTNYLNRLVSTFNMKYADKIEVYSFSSLDLEMNEMNNRKIDVLLINYSIPINIKDLPDRCCFAYLVDATGIDSYNEKPAICKFQKIEQIYKQILALYSEKVDFVTTAKGDGDCKVICFSSPEGGVGTSTVAAACAMHMVRQGKKTMYLNLERFGSADIFFEGEGQFGLSDVIYALKSKKSNLQLKIESCVKQDKSGVFYFSQSHSALDILELNVSEMIELLSVIRRSGEYAYIILDLDFEITKDIFSIWENAHQIVWVCDGSGIGNTKTYRALQAMQVKDENLEVSILARTSILYNKMANSDRMMMQGLSVTTLGGLNKYQGDMKKIMEAIAINDVFDKLA